MPRQLTQAEIDRILFNQRMGLDPRGQVPMPSVQNLQQRTSGTITPINPNAAQLAASGAGRVAQFLNQILPNAQQVVTANPLNLEALFPTATAPAQVTIPTGFNFGPEQKPTGEVLPGGLQTNQVNLNQLLSAIKPADVLGVTGAQRAYTDIGIGKAPNPMDVLDMATLGAVGYGTGKAALKATKGMPVGMSIQDAPGLLQAAPKSDIGFYSAVEQAAIASPRKQGAGQAFLNDIMKGQDVRADEIKWMGLDDYLKGKQNVTKQEVQDYIANNRVDVQEVKSKIPRLPGEEMPGDEGAFLPKFGQYTLPGGENYRELLLTMPSNMSQYNKYVASLRAKYGEGGLSNLPLTDIERSRLDKFYENDDLPSYESSHFPGQPNILAHLRVNDRVDADGKKMLLIEEVQSDWHQAGRDKGYKGQLTSLPDDYFVSEMQNKAGDTVYEIRKTSNPNVIINRDYNRQSAINGAINTLNETVMGVPDAPFKDTWYQLALKRAIQHAAENGYDRIGLTTGSQQAARFDLSKQVDSLVLDKSGDGYLLTANRGGRPVIDEQFTDPKKLESLIGKEASKKLLEKVDAAENRGGVQTGKLDGVDLQVGGEGMKKYYDEIYPKFLDKYGKKWGAKVGETKVNADGIQEPIRYIDITPEMKAGVSKGQPLFQAAPIIGTGLLGSQQERK
jgi:hypothetical protein